MKCFRHVPIYPNIWELGRRFGQVLSVLHRLLLLRGAAKSENEDSVDSSGNRNAQNGQKRPFCWNN